MVTDQNQAYCGDHFEMYRNIESLCCVTGTNSVVGQLYFKNKQTKELIEKDVKFVVTRGRGQGEGKLDEGSKEVQISSYKCQGCHVQHDKYN